MHTRLKLACSEHPSARSWSLGCQTNFLIQSVDTLQQNSRDQICAAGLHPGCGKVELLINFAICEFDLDQYRFDQKVFAEPEL